MSASTASKSSLSLALMLLSLVTMLFEIDCHRSTCWLKGEVGFMTFVIIRPDIGSYAMIKTKDGLRELGLVMQTVHNQMRVLGKLMGMEVPKFRTQTSPLMKM